MFPAIPDRHARRDTDPYLPDYHRIVVNHSGGKDSQAALITTARRAEEQGVSDRVIVQYNNLGDMVWPSTVQADDELAAEGFTPWLFRRFGKRPGCRELAFFDARQFGFRFEVTSRAGNDLLADVERRGKFPDAARRWCRVICTIHPSLLKAFLTLINEFGVDLRSLLVEGRCALPDLGSLASSGRLHPRSLSSTPPVRRSSRSPRTCGTWRSATVAR